MKNLYLDDFLFSRDRQSTNTLVTTIRKPKSRENLRRLIPLTHVELRFYSFIVSQREEEFTRLSKKDVLATEFLDTDKVFSDSLIEIETGIERPSAHAYLMRKELNIDEISLSHRTEAKPSNERGSILNYVTILYPHLKELTEEERIHIEESVIELLEHEFGKEKREMSFDFSHFTNINN